jgi:preprotein translocase subunit Sss1
MGEPVVPLSVKIAAIGLLSIGALIGFIAGLVTGWCARERR